MWFPIQPAVKKHKRRTLIFEEETSEEEDEEEDMFDYDALTEDTDPDWKSGRTPGYGQGKTMES